MKFIPLIIALAGMLAAPAAFCQKTSAALPNAVNVTVTKQRKMLVEGRVNAMAGNFLVDTGAGNSYISERFASALRVQRNEGGVSYNVMGQMRFDVADVRSFELGKNRIPLIHALIHISNLGWVDRNSGGTVSGIIGADLLIRNQAVIDCAQGRILFDSSGARAAGAQKFAARFISRAGDELAIVARINGVTGTFIIDTGYNVSLLSPDFAFKLEAGRATKSRTIAIAAMEIGGSRIPVGREQMVVSNRVNIANQGFVELGESPYDGVLGMDFLLNHHAVIDCRRMQLLFN